MSSAWLTGVGNLPAAEGISIWIFKTGKSRRKLTLGQTGTEQTGNLLDQSLGSKEGIVLASKLLDELLVLVQLLQVIGGHGIDAVVLGTVKIVLVTKNTIIQQSLVNISS